MQRQRDSNIELLRCLAMFLILVIHANFVSLPMIDAAELQGNTLPSVFRFFIESVGIVAINVFVFISGWYGIRPRKEKVLSLLFMVLWFFVGFYLVLLIAGKATLSWKEIADALQLSDYEWFIKSYFLLIIISPILNSFNATADEKTQRYVVIAFFLFEAVFGWIAGGRRFFVNGYGPLHFIGLYVTAGYIRNRLDAESAPQLFRTLFRLPAAADLGIFFLLAAVNTGLMIAGAMYSGSFSGVFSIAYAYCNPLVILGSIYLFLFFSKLKMAPFKIVNWLGASSFAVYLLHSEPHVRNLFVSPQVQYLYENYSGLACLGIIALFLCLVFMAAMLLDLPRKLIWSRLVRLVKP